MRRRCVVRTASRSAGGSSLLLWGSPEQRVHDASTVTSDQLLVRRDKSDDDRLQPRIYEVRRLPSRRNADAEGGDFRSGAADLRRACLRGRTWHHLKPPIVAQCGAFARTLPPDFPRHVFSGDVYLHSDPPSREGVRRRDTRNISGCNLRAVASSIRTVRLRNQSRSPISSTPQAEWGGRRRPPRTRHCQSPCAGSSRLRGAPQHVPSMPRATPF